MKIVFLTRRAAPQIGGVESHIEQIAKCLRSTANEVKIISEADIKYPHLKFIGLIYIWFWLFKNRKLILDSDIVHIHDVFIWYLPFKFLYPNKRVFTTFHGWEGKYPIPFINILQKRIANKLSLKTISVGDYINKWYGIKSDIIIYGAVDKINIESAIHKISNTIIYLGRLEKDTGLLEFLKWLKLHPVYKITFIGVGDLKDKCRKFGKVLGSKDPEKYLQEAEYCVPSGYLSYLEARNLKCKIMTFPNNPLKADYWDEIEKNYSKIKNVTWNDVTNSYLKLWK